MMIGRVAAFAAIMLPAAQATAEKPAKAAIAGRQVINNKQDRLNGNGVVWKPATSSD